MEAEYLHLFVDYFGSLGMRFSPSQKSAMQNSLPILKHQMKFRKLYFWGKIFASTDYYVVQGVENNFFRRKTVVSQDLINWALLNPPTPEDRAKVRLLRGSFKGSMSEEIEQKVLHAPTENLDKIKSSEDMDNEEDEEEEEEEEEDEKEGKKKEENLDDMIDDSNTEIITMKEEDRLAAVVAEIDDEALLVPRKAFVLTAAGLVEENRFFCGLSPADATDLGNYCHFRPARLTTMKRVKRADYDPSTEFLDTAGDDVPEGIWRLQYERGGALVFLRNFLWPGYAFYHLPGTAHYGSLYMGDGLYNIDFPFMV